MTPRKLQFYTKKYVANVNIYRFFSYLHKGCNFGSQSDALSYVEEKVQEFVVKNIGNKFKIVIGTYLIGKEKVWIHLIQTFKIKVWFERERRKAMDVIFSEGNDDRRITDYFCNNPSDAQLHVIPLQCINDEVKY